MTRTNSQVLISLNTAQHEFVDSVLALKPRVAVFDCDGTLWSGDAGADFFYWEIERGLIPAEVAEWIVPRYADYKQGKVDEVTICGEMVQIHRGIPLTDIVAAAKEFVATVVQRRIFPEMLELAHRLKDAGCELWAVSSTNDWVIAAGVEQFGIPVDHVLAACVQTDGTCASDKLIRVPTDELKAVAIREAMSVPPDAVFGNSMHDAAMLDIARHAFAINPNPDLDSLAAERGWKRYYPLKHKE